jgi:hypothetical protein
MSTQQISASKVSNLIEKVDGAIRQGLQKKKIVAVMEKLDTKLVSTNHWHKRIC